MYAGTDGRPCPLPWTAGVLLQQFCFDGGRCRNESSDWTAVSESSCLQVMPRLGGGGRLGGEVGHLFTCCLPDIDEHILEYRRSALRTLRFNSTGPSVGKQLASVRESVYVAGGPRCVSPDLFRRDQRRKFRGSIRAPAPRARRRECGVCGGACCGETRRTRIGGDAGVGSADAATGARRQNKPEKYVRTATMTCPGGACMQWRSHVGGSDGSTSGRPQTANRKQHRVQLAVANWTRPK